MIEKLNSNEKLQKALPWVTDLLVILFMLLITVGSYVKIKTGVIIVYLLICIFLAVLQFRKLLSDFIHSPMMICWVIYCLAGLLSTIFIEHERDMYIVETQISFTFILFTLTRYMDYKKFFPMFRIMVGILVLIGLFQQISGIDIFRFLKVGTPFPSEDIWTHAIISLFEYRHYFGCYLLLAFFSLFFFPEKKLIINLIYGALYLLAIVLTYTRCIWGAFALGVLGLLIYGIAELIRKRKEDSKKIRILPVHIISSAAVLLVAVFLIIIFRKNVQEVIRLIRIRMITGVDPSNGSVSNRLFTIQNGTAYVLSTWQKNIWIGMGNGSALKWLATAEGAVFREAIDCQYVHTFMETGIVGLGSLIAMIVYSIIYFLRSRDQKIVLFSLTFLMIAASFFFYEVIVVSSSVYALWSFVLMSLCSGHVLKDELAERNYRKVQRRKEKNA